MSLTLFVIVCVLRLTWFFPVMATDCVLCEVETCFACIIYMSVGLESVKTLCVPETNS